MAYKGLQYLPSGSLHKNVAIYALNYLEYNWKLIFRTLKDSITEFITVSSATIVVYSKVLLLNLEIMEPENIPLF